MRELLELVGSADNLAFLNSYLRAAHPGLSSHDAEDIAARVLTRLIERVRRGEWEPQPEQRMLRAYLRTAANWAVIDTFRQASRNHELSLPTPALPESALSDDETANLLEQAATAEAVRAALRGLQADGDATAFRVITCMLDQIQRAGTRPSNRQIANSCKLSHTAVAKALVRARPYFATARTLGDEDSST